MTERTNIQTLVNKTIVAIEHFVECGNAYLRFTLNDGNTFVVGDSAIFDRNDSYFDTSGTEMVVHH